MPLALDISGILKNNVKYHLIVYRGVQPSFYQVTTFPGLVVGAPCGGSPARTAQPLQQQLLYLPRNLLREVLYVEF